LVFLTFYLNPIKQLAPNKQKWLYAVSAYFICGETRKSKCNADERCRRQLDGGEPLSAPTGADANESRHSDQKSKIRFCGFWAVLLIAP